LNEVALLLADLHAAVPDAEELIRWTAGLPLPKLSVQQNFTCVSMAHPLEYPMNEGRIVSDTGLDIGPTEFEQYFQEQQVPYSTALQCTLTGNSYLVGPLARLNLNYHHLPRNLTAIIEDLGLHFPSKNMFHSVVARAIEVCYGILEAIRILKNYQLPSQSYVRASPKKGIAYGCTEAPRGTLWHRYEIGSDGIIQLAKIVSPTSQNQYRIEEDLRISLESAGLARSDDEMRLQSEIIIRNYDPCISCSTHFLTLRTARLI
ncbi:MAG: nickel-dependent hydrogenase large subunit, partial [Burkholderiales bacterium]